MSSVLNTGLLQNFFCDTIIFRLHITVTSSKQIDFSFVFDLVVLIGRNIFRTTRRL